MKVSAKFRPQLVDLLRIHVKGLFTYTKLIQLNNNNNNLKKTMLGLVCYYYHFFGECSNLTAY